MQWELRARGCRTTDCQPETRFTPSLHCRSPLNSSLPLGAVLSAHQMESPSRSATPTIPEAGGLEKIGSHFRLRPENIKISYHNNQTSELYLIVLVG